ncbi:MAG: Rnf-Nqr domain containing protein [Pseudohongiella sp.]|nr:Rnf-Nqr domain containing protein [Pseudohongiella sp.]
MKPHNQSEAALHHSPLILLSLTSLISASTSSGLALFIGLTSCLVLLVCSVILWLVRPWLQKDALLARADSALTLAFIALLLASVVSSVSVIIQMTRFEAFAAAGIWLPLIASNALIYMHLLRSWESTETHMVGAAMVRGAQFTAVLLVLALLREVLGLGSILTNMQLLLPSLPQNGLSIFDNYPRLKVFALPAGGLLVLSLVLALIEQLRLRKPHLGHTRLPSDEKRVRVTGRIQ